MDLPVDKNVVHAIRDPMSKGASSKFLERPQKKTLQGRERSNKKQKRAKEAVRQN